MRPGPDAELEAILVLRTLGAPERRLLRGRKGRSVERAEPEPVPTTRATVVRPEAFDSPDQAEEWLATLRRDQERREGELAEAIRVLNVALHAHRVARADPAPRDASIDQALVIRLGFGAGDAVADGRFDSAWELPGGRRRAKRSMETPEERFASILSGRERSLPSEELVLRARADLDAGRAREAALQARVALESLLADLPSGIPGRAELEGDRGAVGEAANAALRGEMDEGVERRLGDALARMEASLRRRRLGGG